MGKISPPIKRQVILRCSLERADLLLPILVLVFNKSQKELVRHELDLVCDGATEVEIYSSLDVAQTKVDEAQRRLEIAGIREEHFKVEEIKPF